MRLQLEDKDLRAGVPAELSFFLQPATAGSDGSASTPPFEGIYNLLFIREHEAPFWNHHGDGSVEAVAAKAGIGVSQRASPPNVFAYRAVFPRPGLWLLDFEVGNDSVNFFLEVGE